LKKDGKSTLKINLLNFHEYDGKGAVKQNIVERRIMWGDLDSLGIVFYPRYYEWIDACGHLFFESLGLTINTLWEERQIQFGLIESSCRYSQPGRYHDQIKIVTQIEDLQKFTLTLKHGIYRASDESLMVTGFEKRVCMNVTDPKNIRAMAIPEDIFRVLKSAMDESAPPSSNAKKD
jgi:YbgC/YbaW family acyl-CoA thioester hydrolase